MTEYLINTVEGVLEELDTLISNYKHQRDKYDEEEHENMGQFTIGLHFKDKKMVYIRFHETKVNMDIVNKACEDFNLQVMHKHTHDLSKRDEQEVQVIIRRVVSYIIRLGFDEMSITTQDFAVSVSETLNEIRNLTEV